MTNKKAVFGIVRSETQAERLIADLRTAGFRMSDVSVLLPGKGATRDFAHAEGTKAPEGAVVGGGAGGALGGTLGLLAGLGALAIPGLGPFIAAGPIFAALSGAAVGAVVGGVAGGLVGLGIPEIQAKLYEGKIRSGNVLVSVHGDDRERIDTAKGVLTSFGATDIAVTHEWSVPVAESYERQSQIPRADQRS